jgi:competence protein ComEC
MASDATEMMIGLPTTNAGGILPRKADRKLMPPTDVFILNVGSGSCTVVSHPLGRKTMIDINNGRALRDYEYTALRASQPHEIALREAARYEQALVNPIDWYRRVFGDQLWRFILSHPDADHMAGVRCLFDGHIQPSVFWDLEHSKPMKRRSEYKTDEAYQDAQAYYTWRRGKDHPHRARWPQRISPTRFEANKYWEDDQIDILSPSNPLLADRDAVDDWNNLSYVLRINHAGRSVLIPGDIEQTGWNDLADTCSSERVSLQADVLVASHHGRKSGYPDDGVLGKIDPSAVIVSAGDIPAKDDSISRYRRNVASVFSTREAGSLLIRIYDSGELDIATGVDTFRDLRTIFSLPSHRAA